MFDLTWTSSWASIISLFISLISLFLIGSIRLNIVKFRRKQRLRGLISEVIGIPSDGIPLSSASKKRIEALSRNIPLTFFLYFGERNKLAKHIKEIVSEANTIDQEKMDELKEVINDWSSFSEDI